MRQCELLGLPRSSYYYQPNAETSFNEMLMHRMDEIYTAHPFMGVGQMTAMLRRGAHMVNPKRIRRLLRLMGLEALYAKPKTSIINPENKVYPYLLRGLNITHSNQVWCTDITYIRMPRGWLYLVAVMDWFSRYVLSWELSPGMDVDFCLCPLNDALAQGSPPTIFNSDQGSQFTSAKFTKRLLDDGIKISMDGRGRAYDNIMIERLWRSVKYEEVYLKAYGCVEEAHEGIDSYLNFYNCDRPHQSLGNRTPQEVYHTSMLN